MKTDSVIKVEGMNILLQNLGKVDAERFIALLIREPFDYTKWQEGMFKELSVRELSKLASEFSNNIDG